MISEGVAASPSGFASVSGELIVTDHWATTILRTDPMNSLVCGIDGPRPNGLPTNLACKAYDIHVDALDPRVGKCLPGWSRIDASDKDAPFIVYWRQGSRTKVFLQRANSASSFLKITEYDQ